MIKLLRIDHRLIHGQVAVFWVSHTLADTIVVASDKYANDQLMHMTLNLGKPKNTVLVILSTSDTISYLNDAQNARKSILLVTGTTAEALKLAKNCDITDVNLGAMPSADGRKKIGMQFFLNDAEMEDIKSIHSLGKNIYLQATTSDKKLLYNDILSIWNK